MPMAAEPVADSVACGIKPPRQGPLASSTSGAALIAGITTCIDFGDTPRSEVGRHRCSLFLVRPHRPLSLYAVHPSLHTTVKSLPHAR